MNISSKNILNVAAALALLVGVYAATDGFAQNKMGGQQGGMPSGGMMGGQQGGMKDGMKGEMKGGMKDGMKGEMKGGMMGGMMGGQQGMDHGGMTGVGPLAHNMMGGLEFAKLTTDTAALEQYLTDLKSTLAITTDQEQAWTAYTTAVKTKATIHTELFNAMHGTTTDQTAETFNQQHLNNMETMIQQQRTVSQAFKTLYDQLNSEQRVIADRLDRTCVTQS